MQSPRSHLTHVACLACGHGMEYLARLDSCQICGSPWLDARYEYQTVAALWANGLERRQLSLWRYAELLPLQSPKYAISMGEGWTPLVKARKLGRQQGYNRIYIKDERFAPTSSFKDRQGAMVVSVLAEAGIQECVLASTGNAAAAYAAYCARADIKLWVFLTSLVPAEKMREAMLYGADVIKVTGTYDQAKELAADFAKRRGIYLDRGAKAIPGKEGMKTIAYEIAEQLARVEGEGGWRAPDWYLQAVSGGIGPMGVLKGFEELHRMGLIDKVPKLAIIQSEGCAPMVRAFAKGREEAEAVTPETLVTVLTTGDPGKAYEFLRAGILEYGGTMISVSDDEAFATMNELALLEGYSVEPATAVAFAGLKILMSQGIMSPDERIVVNCSGHTFPVEKLILGDRHAVEMQLADALAEHGQHEGLLAALEQLEEQVTSIVIIDDNAVDVQLIKRLLQTNKPYRVYEAPSGQAGLNVVAQTRPDLIILDLTMPEMDGFSVLEELKANPETKSIPVIVVSAKELSLDEQRYLADVSDSVWQKGAFGSIELMAHVVKTLHGERLSVSADEAPLTKPLPQPKKDSMVAAFNAIERGTKQIVIIDDNPLDARLIRRILEAQQTYEIREARSGPEGLALIDEHRPDLVVLDLTMPDMDGFSVIERLKANAETEHIPIIIVSAKELAPQERFWLSDHISSMWQKGSLNRERLLSDVEKMFRDEYVDVR
jgi:threonine synthase